MVTIDTIYSRKASEEEGAVSLPRERRNRLWLDRIGRAVAQWWRIRSTRQGLAELDEDLLRDIGVSPAEARAEMKRSLYLLEGAGNLSSRAGHLFTHDRW